MFIVYGSLMSIDALCCYTQKSVIDFQENREALQYSICSINEQSVILNFNWIVYRFSCVLLRQEAGRYENNARKRFVSVRCTLDVQIWWDVFVFFYLSRVCANRNVTSISITRYKYIKQSITRKKKKYKKNITAGHYSPISC